MLWEALKWPARGLLPMTVARTRLYAPIGHQRMQLSGSDFACMAAQSLDAANKGFQEVAFAAPCLAYLALHGTFLQTIYRGSCLGSPVPPQRARVPACAIRGTATQGGAEVTLSNLPCQDGKACASSKALRRFLSFQVITWYQGYQVAPDLQVTPSSRS